jgi:hypothetical protein
MFARDAVGYPKKKRTSFLKKKKQKTFNIFSFLAVRRVLNRTYLNDQKFFGSFFQKRTPFFLLFRCTGASPA